MNALIFGTGSIACRHSRILHEFGFSVIAVTDRIEGVQKLYHENSFCKVVQRKDWKRENSKVFVIATVTSRHTEIVEELLEEGVSPENIYCEKPGPAKFFGINTLYNLQFLKPVFFTNEFLKVRHCANAKVWPSDMPWHRRYMFNQSEGGGALLTHSHELIRAFGATPPGNTSEVHTTQIMGSDDQQVCTKYKALWDGTKIELDLLADEPVRYWETSDHVIHFYGDLPPHARHKDVINITVKMVEESYCEMWRELLERKNKELQKNFAWIFDNVS